MGSWAHAFDPARALRQPAPSAARQPGPPPGRHGRPPAALPPARRRGPAPPGRAALLALAALLAAGALGCQREILMTRAYDASRPATTIRYSGVREETRVYPDYGSIDASVLGAPPTGKGKRRPGPGGRPAPEAPR